MVNDQKAPINVEATTTVTMSYSRFEALKNVEADKERYAQHVLEANKNLDEAVLRIKELEDEVIRLSTSSKKPAAIKELADKPVKAKKK